MLKEKHVQKIYSDALAKVYKKLDRLVEPFFKAVGGPRSYFGDVPREMLKEIEQRVYSAEISQFPSDKDKSYLSEFIKNETKRLQNMGLTKYLYDLSDLLEDRLRERNEEFYDNFRSYRFIDDQFDKLTSQILNGKVGQESEWVNGAGISIVSDKFRKDDRNYQVIVDDEQLARKVSWVFQQLRDVMSPMINFSSKYEFFGCLAKCVEKGVHLNQLTEKELYLEIVREARRYRDEENDSYLQNHDERKIILEEIKVKSSSLRHQAERFDNNVDDLLSELISRHSSGNQSYMVIEESKAGPFKSEDYLYFLSSFNTASNSVDDYHDNYFKKQLNRGQGGIKFKLDYIETLDSISDTVYEVDVIKTLVLDGRKYFEKDFREKGVEIYFESLSDKYYPYSLIIIVNDKIINNDPDFYGKLAGKSSMRLIC